MKNRFIHYELYFTCSDFYGHYYGYFKTKKACVAFLSRHNDVDNVVCNRVSYDGFSHIFDRVDL